MLKIDFPLYDVTTPQTLLPYKVRSLTYNEELKLKASIPSENTIISHLNRTIFDCIVEFPEEVKNYDDFLDKTTIEDRKAIIAAIYHASYGDSYIVTDICPRCEKTVTSKVLLTKAASVKFYEGEPLQILEEQRREIVLPISKDKFIIKIPTLRTEEYVYKAAEEQQEELLVRATYVEEIHSGESILTIANNVYDIIVRIGMLPSKDRRELDKACLKILTSSGITLKYKVACKNCGNRFISNIDFVAQLFRMVFE